MAEYPIITEITDSGYGIIAPDDAKPADELTLEEQIARSRRWALRAVQVYYPDAPDAQKSRLREIYEQNGGNVQDLIEIEDDQGSGSDSSDSGDDAPYTDDGSPGGYENPYLSDDDGNGRQAVRTGGGIPWLLVGAAGAGLVGVFVLARSS